MKITGAPRTRSWFGRLCLALLVSLGLWWFYEYATLPDAHSLLDGNPETTALIRARDAAARSEGRKPRHRQHWVPLT
ncbi:MAG TPA: monofunctional biosynthetic peptidoglycan transglycosylase, partial [Myxococcaceae bacterium]|nr:monofunctional biosynthetic peptidoglycan transglycosylase [Myxococcaceae bacterium]